MAKVNRIIEIVLCHLAVKHKILGIEPEYGNHSIHIYLDDGSIIKHRIAGRGVQFHDLLREAQQQFRDIHWHEPDEAIPYWMFPKEMKLESPKK